MKLTGQASIESILGRRDSHPNEHWVRPRKARKVQTLTGAIKEVEIWWTGGGTYAQPGKHWIGPRKADPARPGPARPERY